MRYLLVLIIPFLFACSEDDEGLVCSADFRYGITVKLFNTVSGEPLNTCETQYKISEGEYVEDEDDSFFTDEFCANTTYFFGAGERAGVYKIEVTKVGYQTWTTEGVIVNRDDCHVENVSVDAFLTPQS